MKGGALLGWLEDLVASGSPAQIAVAIFAATLISEEMALIFAFSAYQLGSISLGLLIASYMPGILFGDFALYSFGRGLRFYSKNQLKYKNNFMTQALKKVKSLKADLFDRVLFFTRFIPGSRTPTYLMAGYTRYPFYRFLSILGLVTLIHLAMNLVFLHLVGQGKGIEFHPIVRSLIAIVLSLILFRSFIFIVRNRKDLPTGIRAAVYSIFRLKYRVGWPIEIIYAPVMLYCVLLMVRYRTLTGFLYVNPQIVNSGWIGESKAALEKQLSKASQRHTLAHVKIESQWSLPEKASCLENFMASNKLSFPIVLKPDLGEKGLAVKRIDSLPEAKQYFRNISYDILAQEKCSFTKELGAMYYRLPNEEKGHIFSIAGKKFPLVVGDGKSPLKQLILKQPRLRYFSHLYLRHVDRNPEDVVPEGEQVVLSSLGNISKGAEFYDAMELAYPQFIQELDQISRNLPNFYFGRYDIRYESEESLAKGHFKIVELNGAGAESSNVHDARFSIIDFYGILFKQWNLIFKIGKLNRKSGPRSLSLFRFLRDLWTTKKKMRHYHV